MPGETYLLTRRCSERRFFLRPDDLTTQIFLYCFAEAAQRFGIVVVAWVALSNHYHAVVEDPAGVLPEFLQHFHKMTARALNARWRRTENLWSSEPPSAVRLVQLHDVVDKVVYALANPVQDHLVDRVFEWPGAHSLAAMDGRRVCIRRPKCFFRDGGAMPEHVTLTPRAPCRWTDTSADWVRMIRAAVDERESAARDERARTGGRVLGRRAIRDARCDARPGTAEPPQKLRPHVACADAERRVAELRALRAFRGAYSEARDAFSKGRHDVVFPAGTYLLVKRLGARAALLPDFAGTASVARPP